MHASAKPRTRLNRRGVAAVEFALIAPILVILLGAATDLGRAIERAIRLENAARAGAQLLTVNPLATSADAEAAMRAAFEPFGSISGVTFTPNVTGASCGCLDATTGAVLSSPAPSTNACPVPSCPNNNLGGVVVYRTVRAQATFAPLFPTSQLIPFNNLGTLQRDVVVRL